MLLNPFHVAGKFDGVNLQQLSSTGRFYYTITRPPEQSTGIYKITFNTSHSSADYGTQVLLQTRGTVNVWEMHQTCQLRIHFILFVGHIQVL